MELMADEVLSHWHDILSGAYGDTEFTQPVVGDHNDAWTRSEARWSRYVSQLCPGQHDVFCLSEFVECLSEAFSITVGVMDINDIGRILKLPADRYGFYLFNRRGTW